MRRHYALALSLAVATASPVAAQDVGALLTGSLGADALAQYWLPDNADPDAAREAVGIAYIPIEGAAGNTDISVGYFARGPQGFALVAPIRELYGQEPRDPAFHADRIEITTTMPGPNDPRCCPTAEARWSIDRQSFAATRLH